MAANYKAVGQQWMVGALSRLTEKSPECAPRGELLHLSNFAENEVAEIEDRKWERRVAEHCVICAFGSVSAARSTWERLILTRTGNIHTSFLQMAKSSHCVVEVGALREFSASLKSLDAITN